MKYKTGRPKGFAAWKPQKGTQEILNQVKEVLEQYREHWPLTIRQIFYRLVGVYGYEKTEHGYRNLCDYMVRARRAEMVPWEAIRDDGTTRTDAKGYIDMNSFLKTVIYSAGQYIRNKQERQPIRILILVEAAGMVPQIVKAVGIYGLSVISSSGFDSLTMKYELAQDIMNDDRPTVVFHIGDLDPSGVCIFDSIQADVEAFVGNEQELQFKRIALTPAQVALYNLPTTPPKKDDKRGEGMRETCQAEALPPDTLAKIVKEAVMQYYDMAVFDEDVQAEQQERALLVERFQGLSA
jgi:hypothetical protein